MFNNDDVLIVRLICEFNLEYINEMCDIKHDEKLKHEFELMHVDECIESYSNKQLRIIYNELNNACMIELLLNNDNDFNMSNKIEKLKTKINHIRMRHFDNAINKMNHRDAYNEINALLSSNDHMTIDEYKSL